MNKKLTNKKKDPELRLLVDDFLQAFHDAAAQTQDDALRIFESGGFSAFPGAIVELTDDVTDNLTKLALRAATLLGAKAGHEKALRDIAMKQAQESLLNNVGPRAAATALIDKLFEEGSTKFQFLVPNYLIVFEENVRSVEIGRVRAMMTEDFAAELSKTPHTKVQVIADQGFSAAFVAGGARVAMHPHCWVVSVDAAKENVDEEAKWLIDIAVSFLRLHYAQATVRFPGLGTVEPHPLRPADIHNIGVKISEGMISLGGGSVPPAYEVGNVIKTLTQEPRFCTTAKVIFDPPEKSLAERVSQGLGWLTRGRQAKDRAERLLYFFTAIESLLSSDDKTAPVVQNIARHAAVLLTNDNAARAKLAADLKKLYALRSALVHAGSRAVLWNNANTTENLAEAMFSRVFQEADLGSSHAKFIEVLSKASYGLPWPVPAGSLPESDQNE